MPVLLQDAHHPASWLAFPRGVCYFRSRNPTDIFLENELTLRPMLPFLDPEDELIDQLIFEERQKFSAEVFVDFGDPLPSRYGVDQLQLMVQVHSGFLPTGKSPRLPSGRL